MADVAPDRDIERHLALGHEGATIDEEAYGFAKFHPRALRIGAIAVNDLA